MTGFLLGTDPGLRKTKTPTVNTFAAGVGFTAGSSTTVSLTDAPGTEEHLTIFFDGVGQHRSTYSVSGSTVTFDTAIPTGVAEVEATYAPAVYAQLSTVGDNSIDGTKTKDALIGDYSDVTITAADLIMYGDATDSNNTKRDTVQGILDLAGGGATAIITRTAFTASSGVEFALDNSTYDSFKIITYYVANVGAADLFIRTSTDGGSSFDSGASDYVFTGVTSLSNATTQTGFNDTGEDHLPGTINGGGSAGTPTLSIIELIRPGTTGRTQLFVRTCHSGGITTRCEYHGQRNASGADVDGVKIYPSANTMTGVTTLIGFKQS